MLPTPQHRNRKIGYTTIFEIKGGGFQSEDRREFFFLIFTRVKGTILVLYPKTSSTSGVKMLKNRGIRRKEHLQAR